MKTQILLTVAPGLGSVSPYSTIYHAIHTVRTLERIPGGALDFIVSNKSYFRLQASNQMASAVSDTRLF